ncbi:MAG: ABC transporter substrate-binding protein, partial [Clostridium butyricum]|nr:ABC transporter substrate-binding protein [Clostridium butyricum]
MKRKLKAFVSVIMIMMFTTIMLIGCGEAKDENITKVRLNEVTRSVFYAPMYIAISEGFFEENGIQIDLQTGQ